MPKYYNNYCLQGHDETGCWNIYSKLFTKVKEESKDAVTTTDDKEQNKQRKLYQEKDNEIKGNKNSQ